MSKNDYDKGYKKGEYIMSLNAIDALREVLQCFEEYQIEKTVKENIMNEFIREMKKPTK